MGLLMMGIFRTRFGARRVVVSISSSFTSENWGTRRTSSKLSPISEFLSFSSKYPMIKSSGARAIRLVYIQYE